MPKLALKIILPTLTYKKALEKLNLDTLENRREKIVLNFLKTAKEHPKLQDLFTKNTKTHEMNTRNPQVYSDNCNTQRLRKSAIMNMKRLINRMMN